MTAIDVVPAGNQLYEVEIRDEDGTSTHEVTVPDAFLEQLDTGGLAVQDLVFAALGFLTEREGHHELGERVDLAEAAQRYEGFAERVLDLARQRALHDVPRDAATAADEDEALSGDDRLVAEVQEEQAQGEASSPTDSL